MQELFYIKPLLFYDVFSFLPIFGTAISISLGILRANVWGVIFWSFIGKFLCYIIVASSAIALK